ncbi:MAG: preprotein translocase subunit SecA [Verrucomicrobiae bacterium]|nr:preprotein translocase subunit SecA [Verrucomicrobiae bacterium]
MPGVQPEKTGRWSTLRRQYAVEGYLHWMSHETGRKLFPKAFAAGRSEENSSAIGHWSDHAKLAEVNELAAETARLGSDQLAARSLQLRDEVRAGRPLAEVIAPAFALVREASRRTIGLFHYDVQVLAGLAMSRGAIAEMATGEGKTLVQSLVAYAWGLFGRGVHVATANSYLAERDQEFSRELFDFLGLTSALLPERTPGPAKRAAYAADVTFGTGAEFGFDYLRDQLERFKMPKPKLGERFAYAALNQPAPERVRLSQRELAFAIIDEVDSILIDEATTPLVISTRQEGPHPHPEAFQVAREIAETLTPDEDYQAEAGSQAIRLTDAGRQRIASQEFPVPWHTLRRPWNRYVENALRAHLRLQRDVNYVVQEDKVVIIDEFTGRARPESSWKDGLHQAVETKEDLVINSESQSAAGISRQRFYRLYENVCGMTGTAEISAGEFWEVFRLPVVSIPRNKASQAVTLPARVFTSEQAKLWAVVRDITERQEKGQPVLVGARTIGNSEKLSALLEAAGISHRLLNARQDAEEAATVAEAGSRGAVTIATNMAGRGTHIDLGAGVAEAGGLHVIALEIEESQRIDYQLTGRSARQGQPGSSQLFLSADDFVLRHYSTSEAEQLAGSDAGETGELSPKAAARWLEKFYRAQARAEKSRYESRLSLLRHDDWLSETKRRL